MEAQNRTFDTDDPHFYLEMHAADQGLSKKRKAIFGEQSFISTFPRWSKFHSKILTSGEEELRNTSMQLDDSASTYSMSVLLCPLPSCAVHRVQAVIHFGTALLSLRRV